MSDHPDPFALSAPFAIDPMYSADRVLPDASGRSLFAPPGAGPQWLYVRGNLEAWLFTRMRHESFHASLNVFHPGSFRAVQPVLYARRRVHLTPDAAGGVKVTLAFHGELHLAVNDQWVLHLGESDSTPEPREFDLAPHTPPGDVEVKVRVHSLAGPPTLLIVGEPLQTDGSWQVSSDDVFFHSPQCMAYVGHERFPHDERLPEFDLSPRAREGDVFDFGLEVIGRPEARVRGEGTARFHPGESRAEAVQPEPAHHEQFVPELTPQSGEVRSPVVLGLRYLRAATRGGLEIEDLCLRASTYPVQYRGAFACGDEQLTRIWMHAAYTLRLCMREMFLDGLKRDRLPWVGDLYLAGLSNAFSFFDAGIMRRSLRALYGAEPHRVDCNGILDYSFFWILALHEFVMHFGDLDFLSEMLLPLGRLLEALEAKRDAGGLIPSAGCTWLFIDWAELDKSGYSSCLEFLSIQALEAASRLYGIAGQAGPADQFAGLVAARRSAARAAFWSEADGAFRDCTETARVGRHGNLLAVLAGVAGEADRARMVERIFRNPSVPSVGTPYMRSLEAAALARCGLADEMLAGLREYWGGMLQAGASSFWESYDPSRPGQEQLAMYGRPFANSFCHAWSSGPVFLLSRDLFGVRPVSPGWSRFTVSPPAVGLEWACAAIPTPHGPIRLDRRDGECRVEVPAGTTLELADRSAAGPRSVSLQADSPGTPVR